MSNPISSLREEDVREQEEQNPSGAESSFGDILNQFEQTHAHEKVAGEQGREATVVAVNDEMVFFDIGQKTEGVMPVSALRDEKGPIPVKPGDVIHVGVKGRNQEGYYELSLIRDRAAQRLVGAAKGLRRKTHHFGRRSPESSRAAFRWTSACALSCPPPAAARATFPRCRR